MPRLSETPLVEEGASLVEASLGRYTEVQTGSVLRNVVLGDYSYVTRFCDLANVRVGKFANIASFVRIGATDHPVERATLHHFTYRAGDYWDDAEDEAAFFEARAARLARLGHDVWIGHGAMIRPEVSVGHGAVVAMGAVVTRDVAPYAVVAGNPARPIRERHPPAIAERLIRLAWWDWSHERLRAALDDFRSLDAAGFLAKYEEAAA
jgi:hypothetical protein